MSRLTEFRKDLNRYEYKQDERGYCVIQEGQLVQKLGKLEVLEEEIGCPLEIVDKALKDGIYVKNMPREDLIKQFGLNLANIKTEWYLSNNIICVNLKDYKTLFWLKEDKSE